MKTIVNLLLAAIITAFCCSIGKADDLIYSNNFTLGAAVNISNTPPTFATNYAGGISNAVWQDIRGTFNTFGPLYANGVDACPNEDYWCLPITPVFGHIYLLAVNMTYTNNPGVGIEVGYSVNFTTNYASDARFNGSANGYDFAYLIESSGTGQLFAGNKTANASASIPAFPANAPSTNTIQILLDTRSAQWGAAAYINGIEMGNIFYYPLGAVNPTNTLRSVGFSQNGSPGLPTAIQYNSMALSTTLEPFVVVQPPVSSIASGGRPWTNSVTALADTNGGTLSYQWYANGAALVNGVNGVSGANTNTLIINPILTMHQFTNYHCTVANNYGSAVSALSSVTVLTNPVVSVPVASSNSVTLFSGSGANVGSSPTFSVSAIGAPSLDYRWYTNGVLVGGATSINASSSGISFTNLQATGPTTFACVVSNSYGQVTNTWYATYTAAPTAAYPQAVLGDLPFDFWRLNESDDSAGNKGALCHDYQSGNNGAYTNLVLGKPGYDSAEPAETSLLIGSYSAQYGYAGRIHGADFATSSGSNAEFTVEAWAQGFADNAGSPVVTEGTFNVNEEFGLGSSTNGTTLYQFYVRAANNTVYKALSSIPVNDFNWHHLVGVCDQANGTLTLYIDGVVAAMTNIPAGAGIIEANAPLTIGAGIASGQTDYGTSSALEFDGYIADVATYKKALSAGQVVNHYSSVPGNMVSPYFTTPPPLATFSYQANQTLTIPMAAVGSGPIGYYWANVTAGGVIASGQTNASGGINATLTIPNASAGLSGDQLELVVTNADSSINLFVTLYNPPAPVTVDYTSSILYSNYFLSSYSGGAWSINGLAPTVANVLVGAPTSVWTDSLGTNDTGALEVNGTPTSPLQDSWTLPFVPHAGYVYTLSATETFLGAPSSWVALGFCQAIVTNGTVGGTARINGGTGSPNGIDWILWQQGGTPQYFATGTANLVGTATETAGNVSHAVQVVLDTTGANWTCYAVIDGHTTSTGTISPTNIINGIILAQNSTGAANVDIQWNTVMLTQTAPGGVPPYAYSPAPPASVTLLADSALSIPTTTFGSAPFGYYWVNTNTAAVLASGASGSMAPLSAGLSIADVPYSWNGDKLALVMTNAYGTNIALVSVTVTNSTIIPTIKPTITGLTFVNGTNLVINATNGQSGGTYYLLSSTNLLAPLNQWLPLGTNVIQTNGGTANGFMFSGTNVINAGKPAQFYILSNTN